MVRRNKLSVILISIVFASKFYSVIQARTTFNMTTKNFHFGDLQPLTTSYIFNPDAKREKTSAKMAKNPDGETNSLHDKLLEDVTKLFSTSARSNRNRNRMDHLRQFFRPPFSFCPQCQTCPTTVSTPTQLSAAEYSSMCPRIPACPVCPPFPTCPACPVNPVCPTVTCPVIPPCPAIPPCPEIPPCPAIPPSCLASISSSDRISVCGLRSHMAVSTANSGIIDVTFAYGDSSCIIVLAAALPSNKVKVTCSGTIPGTKPTIGNPLLSQVLVSGTTFELTGFSIITIPQPIAPTSQLQCSWSIA